MTLPACVRVAKEVFLDKSVLYFRDLIATVEMQARTPTRAWRRSRVAEIAPHFGTSNRDDFTARQLLLMWHDHSNILLVAVGWPL